MHDTAERMSRVSDVWVPGLTSEAIESFGFGSPATSALRGRIAYRSSAQGRGADACGRLSRCMCTTGAVAVGDTPHRDPSANPGVETRLGRVYTHARFRDPWDAAAVKDTGQPASASRVLSVSTTYAIPQTSERADRLYGAARSLIHHHLG
jgi:hypothetical protein